MRTLLPLKIVPAHIGLVSPLNLITAMKGNAPGSKRFVALRLLFPQLVKVSASTDGRLER